MGLILTLTRIIPQLLTAMGAVETIFKYRKGGTSEEKKEAYIEAAMTSLGITEGIMQKDLLDDDKFRKMMGKFADNVIEIHNFIDSYKSRTKV